MSDQIKKELSELTAALADYWGSVMSEAVPSESDPEASKVCPVCGGMGWYTIAGLPYNHPQFSKPVGCDNPKCEAGRNWQRARRTAAQLPDDLIDLTFKTMKVRLSEMDPATGGDFWEGKTLAYGAAQMFVEQLDHMVRLSDVCKKWGLTYEEWMSGRAKNWLVFYGDLGMGKTGLLACIVNALIARGYTGIIFVRAREMLRNIQDGYKERESADELKEMTATQRLRRFQTARLLVIDECSLKKQSDDRVDNMEEIIRYRRMNKLPTLISTNLEPAEFYAHWGDQTADVAMEYAHWIKVKGSKLRITEPGLE